MYVSTESLIADQSSLFQLSEGYLPLTFRSFRLFSDKEISEEYFSHAGGRGFTSHRHFLSFMANCSVYTHICTRIHKHAYTNTGRVILQRKQEPQP